MANSIVTQMLKHARKNEYAVPAFNVFNIETINAVVKAAEELKSPVILAVTPVTVLQIGMRIITTLVRAIAWRSSIPVALHLDHGHNLDFIRECILAGFDSVMIDASSEDIETNISKTREIVNQARGRGKIAVEAGLGYSKGNSTITDINIKEDYLTNPEDAIRFANQTGVDALAIAVDKNYIIHKKNIDIDLVRLRTIRDKIRVPLVFPRASGLSDKQLTAIVKTGINKVNISTDIRTIFTNAIREHLQKNKNETDILGYLGVGEQAVSVFAKNIIKICGSTGKSSLV